MEFNKCERYRSVIYNIGISDKFRDSIYNRLYKGREK